MHPEVYRVARKVLFWAVALPLASMFLTQGLLCLCVRASIPLTDTTRGLCSLPIFPILSVYGIVRTWLPGLPWLADVLMVLVGFPLHGIFFWSLFGR